jgi:hypothetical protein
MSKERIRRIKALANREGIDMGSAASTYWLMEQMQGLGQMQRASILNKGDSAGMIRPGRFYFFAYSPKGRAEMPFFDMFPLVYVMNRQSGGKFLGVNFHYLQPRLRAWFINSLLRYANDPEWYMSEDAFVRAVYPMFKTNKSLRFYKPTIKTYIKSHIVSKVVEVPPSEWKTVMFMPLERFAKMSSQDVYKWSRQQL